MPYLQGPDFLSDTTEVRRLARKVIPADWTDEQITIYQFQVYSGIKTLTDKTDWDSNDTEYGILQLYEKEIAALEIRKHFAQDPSELESLDRSIDAAWARFRLNVVGELDTDTGAGTGGSVFTTEYKGWILNSSSVAAPNRLNPSNTRETETFNEIDF